MAEIPSVKYTLNKLKEQSSITLKLHFPSNKTVSDPGTRLTRAESKDLPSLSLSSSLIKDPATKYIAIALDLDAPFPSWPSLSPILHGIQTDLVASAAPDTDGCVKLEAGSVAPVVSYVSPAPPPLSAPHRYVVMIWKQPEGMDAEGVRKALGLPQEVSRWARVRWEAEAAEKKMGLGPEPLAGNSFVAN
jgi:hypothetical protein